VKVIAVVVVVVVECASRPQTADAALAIAMNDYTTQDDGDDDDNNDYTPPHMLAVGGRRPLPLFPRPPAPQRALWPAGW
jgi:hypothetical protein